MNKRQFGNRNLEVSGLGPHGHSGKNRAAVTVLSRSNAKQGDTLSLDADRLLVSADEEAMAQSANAFDLIIDTVSQACPLAASVKPRKCSTSAPSTALWQTSR